MKNFKRACILLSGILIFASCSGDDDLTSTLSEEIENPEFVDIIEENFSEFPKNTQISIAIVDGASTEYIGVINDDNVLRRIDNENDIFEIGSITKVFTSICLSEMIASGEASLTETIKSHFDFSLNDGEDITLMELSNHTSGLPRVPSLDQDDFDPNDPYADYGLDDLQSYLENEVELHNDGWEYSNLGGGMLGYILSNKMETSYENMLQELILGPLEMSSSTTLLSQVNKEKLVKGLDINGNETLNWNWQEVSAGAGSLKSTVVDLEKFARKNFEDDDIYNLPQESTYTVADGYDMGLGWLISYEQDYRQVWHDGGTGGYSSYLVLDKDSKKAVIILSNMSSYFYFGHFINQMGIDLMDNLSGRQ